MTNKVNLVEWIKKHPNAVFTVDNDYWWAYSSADVEDDCAIGIIDDDELAEHGHYVSASNASMPYKGYGSGNCYGGDILQALAEIVGVKVDSV